MSDLSLTRRKAPPNPLGGASTCDRERHVHDNGPADPPAVVIAPDRYPRVCRVCGAELNGPDDLAAHWSSALRELEPRN